MSCLSAARLVLAGLVMVTVGLPTSASAEGAEEIVHLAELVSFLRGRVRAEHPALLNDPGAQVREFREELAKLDLDPPAGVPLDPFLDDLRMAGLLFEEQLRRRRNSRRNALIAETDEALADIFEGALQVANSPDGASIVPEVARIFQVIHSDRRGTGLGRPARSTPARSTPARTPPARTPPARTTPVPVSTAIAASRSTAKDLSTRVLAEPAVTALAQAGLELRAALAADPAKARATAASGFGDVTHKVASARAPRVVVRQVAPLAASTPKATPSLAPARLASLPRKPAPPPRIPALPRVAPVVRSQVAPAVGAAVPDDRADLAQVLAKVKALVAPQVSDDAEFPAVLRGTLSTFGIKAPRSFRPRVGDTPQQMADSLLEASTGSLDLRLARAALAL